MTIENATYKFVNELNAIPQGMIADLITVKPEYWYEITLPAVNHAVSIYNGKHQTGEVIEYNDEKDFYTVKIDGDDEIIEVGPEELEPIFDDYLPIWGTMWSFNDKADEDWLYDSNGLQIMSDLGFRIYNSDEYGIFFGIDGAGYDFFEKHWGPLYKAMGLKWHTEE